MDIKSEIEIKDELLESSDVISNDDSFEQNYELKEIQHENNLYPNKDTKDAVEIKDEQLIIKEEPTENGQNITHIFIVDKNQTLIKDIEVEDVIRDEEMEGDMLKAEISSARERNLSIEKMDLEKLCCKFRFKSKDKLKSHLKSQSHRNFKCLNCFYKSKLKYHLCSHESNHKQSLKSPILKHKNFKLFKCSECDFECNHKGNLKSHMLTHTNFKLFKCSECEYESNRKGNLKTHMLTHSNFKLYKCSNCKYECNQKVNLKTHMLTHANLKLFKCSECSYECNHEGNLKTHMLAHANFKLFKCSQCDYECNQKGNLKRHLLTHENLKEN